MDQRPSDLGLGPCGAFHERFPAGHVIDGPFAGAKSTARDLVNRRPVSTDSEVD